MRFEWNIPFQDDWGNFYRQSSYQNDPLYKTICTEATEYFNKAFGSDQMHDYQYRERLTKEQKDRVVEFMKSRLEWYGQNGFLLPV